MRMVLHAHFLWGPLFPVSAGVDVCGSLQVSLVADEPQRKDVISPHETRYVISRYLSFSTESRISVSLSLVLPFFLCFFFFLCFILSTIFV